MNLNALTEKNNRFARMSGKETADMTNVEKAQRQIVIRYLKVATEFDHIAAWNCPQTGGLGSYEGFETNYYAEESAAFFRRKARLIGSMTSYEFVNSYYSKIVR